MAGVVVLFVVTLWVVLRLSEGGGLPGGQKVAIVEIEGTIIDTSDVVRELREDLDNSAVRAVVVRINSPGGVVGPTQEVYGELRRLRKAGKPVVASLADGHAQFLAAVAAGPHLEPRAAVAFADGRIFSGAQAKSLHMVDALGGLEDAVEGAAELAGLPPHPRVIQPRLRFSLYDLLRTQLDLRGLSGMTVPPPLLRMPPYLMD